MNGFDDLQLPNLSQRDYAIVQRFHFVEYSSSSDSVDIEVPDILQNEEEDADVAQESSGTKKTVSPEMTEALKRRRAALKERRMQIKRAWEGWENPVLKPGDIVTMLRPILTDDFCGEHVHGTLSFTLSFSYRNSRILIVHRFGTENDERNLHLVWIPGDTPLRRFSNQNGAENSFPSMYCSAPRVGSSDVHANIRSVSLIAMHSGRRGPERYPLVSRY